MGRLKRDAPREDTGQPFSGLKVSAWPRSQRRLRITFASDRLLLRAALDDWWLRGSRRLHLGHGNGAGRERDHEVPEAEFRVRLAVLAPETPLPCGQEEAPGVVET